MTTLYSGSCFVATQNKIKNKVIFFLIQMQKKPFPKTNLSKHKSDNSHPSNKISFHIKGLESLVSLDQKASIID